MQDRHERPERETEKASAEKSAPIKVDPMRLETMLELIGEMVVIKSQLAHNRLVASSGDPELQALVTNFDRTVRDLQEKTLSLRLTPLKPLFMKIQRVVRDLALKQGKNVQFTMEGEDTEIDRGLIEAVTDPLLHIARNAIDHGQEFPQQRAAAGKLAVGDVTMSARTLGDRVVIELREDGRGIDREKVLAKARERGLIAESAGPEMSDRDVYDLLFEPGFSTAEKVTEVSGRGVGLDVVRTALEKVRGHVDIESKLGEGTSFRISLPLTTAITDGLLVTLSGVKFVLPLSGVREIVRTSEYKITKIDSGAKVIGLRGRFLPLVDLRTVLRFDFLAKTAAPTTGIRRRPVDDSAAIIAEHGGGLSALLVDEVIGQIQVVVKALADTVRRTDGLTGGAILGDGSVALVLDLDGVAREHNRWMNTERPKAV